MLKKCFFVILLVASAIPTKTIIAAEIDPWLTKLGYCESRNRDDIKTLDSNNKFSYGRYQYQLSTWNAYIKKYNLLPNAEVGEYQNFIWDGEVQGQLTRKILQEKDGWRNWKWCSVKTGLSKWLAMRQM